MTRIWGSSNWRRSTFSAPSPRRSIAKSWRGWLARQRAAEDPPPSPLQRGAGGHRLIRGPDHVYELANPLYCQLVGGPISSGRRGREAVPELVDQASGISSIAVDATNSICGVPTGDGQ